MTDDPGRLREAAARGDRDAEDQLVDWPVNAVTWTSCAGSPAPATTTPATSSPS